MTAERNASLVRRYFEECVSEASGHERARALSTVDELMTDDFVMFYNSDHDARAMHGREAHKQFLVDHAQHFPDDRWTVEVLISDDHSAACQWRIQSSHVGTGNSIDVRAADFYRVRDGRIAELRRFLDFKDLARQTRPSAR